MDIESGLQALAVFGFLAVVVWAKQRREDRESTHRHELYRRMLEAPGGSVEAVEALMQQEQDRRDQRARRDQQLSGMVMVAVGVGLGIFLQGIAPGKPIYRLALVPGLLGLVLLLQTRRVRG